MTLPAANPTGPNYFFTDDVGGDLGHVAQSPLSTTLFSVDYSDWLAENETIVSASVSVTPWGFTVWTPDVITASGVASTGISFLAGGGVEGTSYALDIAATTSVGQIKVDRLYVDVATPGVTVGTAVPVSVI